MQQCDEGFTTTRKCINDFCDFSNVSLMQCKTTVKYTN
jgi:hypothetical protein